MHVARGNIYILFFLLFTLPAGSYAQVKGKVDKTRNTENLQYWEGGLFFGPSIFLGDIKYYRYVPAQGEWRFAYGTTLGRRFSALLGIRGTLLSGKLAGKQKSGNHRMESQYTEMNLNGLLYLDNLLGGHRTDRLVQPYLIAGIGLVFYQSSLYTRLPDRLIESSGKKTEGILLLGLGIDFYINRQWSVTLESANRGMDSDYMDLWHSGFPYDVYNVTMAGIKFRFGITNGQTGYYPQRVIKRKLHRAF